MTKQIVLASNNQGKLSEFQQLFDTLNLGVQMIPQGQLGIDDAVEDGLSFVENAIIKARHASRISGLPAIADDSGLCVPVLGNMPGIYSARYASMEAPLPNLDRVGIDRANNQKLIQALAKLRQDKPIEAAFICVLVMVRHVDDPLPLIAQGQWSGEILEAPRGEGGFGYDPLFYLPELGKTSAELDKVNKNAISHRGQALQQLVAQLKTQWLPSD